MIQCNLGKSSRNTSTNAYTTGTLDGSNFIFFVVSTILAKYITYPLANILCPFITEIIGHLFPHDVPLNSNASFPSNWKTTFFFLHLIVILCLDNQSMSNMTSYLTILILTNLLVIYNQQY